MRRPIHEDDGFFAAFQAAEGARGGIALDGDTFGLAPTIGGYEGGNILKTGGFGSPCAMSGERNAARVPFFGDLPYIGFMFRNQQNTSSKTELLVFITPRIVNERLTIR